MRISPASQHDARLIGEIYRQAFPESVCFFFADKSSVNLRHLLELSFALTFCWGAEGVLAFDNENQPAGYLLYSTETKSPSKRKPLKALALAFRIARNLSLAELCKLTHNQLLMSTSTKYTKKVPKPQARILSVAVSPAYQGQGVGTLLLDYALAKLPNESVGLNVRTDNIAGRKLYDKAGFLSYGITKDLKGTWLILIRDT